MGVLLLLLSASLLELVVVAAAGVASLLEFPDEAGAAVVVVLCVWDDCDWDGDGGVWLTISQAASVLLKDLNMNREDHNAPRWHNTFVKLESHSRVAVLYSAGESEDRSNSSSGSNESIAA